MARPLSENLGYAERLEAQPITSSLVGLAQPGAVRYCASGSINGSLAVHR